MTQEEKNLMTVDEFTAITHKWARLIEQSARRKLMTDTHSSGNLARELRSFVDQLSRKDPPYKVKFGFERYGVFRAYGAGRGYVVVNGQIVKGTRVRSIRDIKLKRWNTIATQMMLQGYKTADVNKAKLWASNDSSIIARTPLDWIDQYISQNIDEFANAVQEFYGDEALQQIANNISKTKIVK